MKRYLIVVSFLFGITAWCAEVETLIQSRDGEVVTTKKMRDGQALIYEYTLVVIQATQAKFSETHAFYLNGEKVFTLFEMGKGKTQRWESKSPAYAFYTIVADGASETVTLSTRPGDPARWSFMRKGPGYFELSASINSTEAQK